MDLKKVSTKILAETSRVLIGVVFIFSGIVKAIDPMGYAIKIEEYLSAFGFDSLNFLSVLASFNITAFEFMLGVCILFGVYRKYVSLFILAFMAVMTPLTLYLAIFDPVSDCGCFGDAVIISNWETFSKNVVLLAASIFVFMKYKVLTPFFSVKAQWFIPIYAYIICVAFAYYNYSHLPIKDFRPYKVGANISELMTIPEGAPSDEYNYSFIYEKDGVKKEFSLEDYPQNDSTWVFVESKMELIKEGYRPQIEAFNLYDSQGDDITEDILTNEGGLFLLVAPILRNASDAKVDEINNLYDYCLEHNIKFYCVTGSVREEISEWEENTGAEYPFLFADKVLLKTIIRSNPGLVLLREGTILEKWHYNDIPHADILDETINEYMNSEVVAHKEDRLLTTNLLTFAVPLLLVWLYDFFIIRRKRKEE